MIGAIPIEVIQREIGLRGKLFDFVKMAWPIVEPGSEFLDNWHISAICEQLELVSSGATRRLLINIPPGCMKSLLVCTLWPVWEWIRTPGTRFIGASFDGQLTLRDAKRSLELIHSPWFQARWGSSVLVAKDAARGDYSNAAGGFRFATSIDGKMTGRHADIIIVDDPHKPQDIGKSSLENVKDWWRGTLQTRFRRPSEGRIVVIMQRLHEEDLSGIVLREEGWVHLKFPMKFEAPGNFADPREKEGELLWPNRFPSATVNATEEFMGSRNTAAQYQQRPSPEGGAVFKREHLSAYWTELPAKQDKWIQSWDLTFKDADTSDYVVGQVWMKSDGVYYLVDQMRARLSFTATLEAIRAMTRKYPRATAKVIEDKANGPAVSSMLGRELSGIIMVNPQGGKEARANAVSPLFEAGNIRLPDPNNVKWVDGYVEEMLAFPVGAHDDQVDATSQALTYMYTNSTQFSEAMKRIRSGEFKI